jgi:hypothetical protein
MMEKSEFLALRNGETKRAIRQTHARELCNLYDFTRHSDSANARLAYRCGTAPDFHRTSPGDDRARQLCLLDPRNHVNFTTKFFRLAHFAIYYGYAKSFGD